MKHSHKTYPPQNNILPAERKHRLACFRLHAGFPTRGIGRAMLAGYVLKTLCTNPALWRWYKFAVFPRGHGDKI
ncbi:hypothetical protein ORI89_05375 [Sphingobacterium sp. UT-1RO-CII-1]|uniref:hypothetical protein n=1 Tax=Sphingobacterium sp. UT-1RO-CII-1 TaxID=2995225 RepID=UPI00227BE8A0|nr:hypothetical protein [Sphingobacterium sp. UT-1RO-CII-1]MCY4779070.1 hypothetical protein [Sphingobacterium sp. UT-1RO-CII-1]